MSPCLVSRPRTWRRSRRCAGSLFPTTPRSMMQPDQEEGMNRMLNDSRAFAEVMALFCSFIYLPFTLPETDKPPGKSIL